MTLGELAGYMQHEVGGSNGASNLTVVKMIGWRRGEFFDETGVRWVNPSPNLRSVSGALLYPGLGMLDFTNVSVGRGTTTPFEVFGAEWIEGKAVAEYLTARNIPGVKFEATRFAVADSAEKYPGHGQTIEGVRIDRDRPVGAGFAGDGNRDFSRAAPSVSERVSIAESLRAGGEYTRRWLLWSAAKIREPSLPGGQPGWQSSRRNARNTCCTERRG